MGKISKTFALFLILIVALSSPSLLMVKLAKAQTATPSIPVPSIPQFSLQLIDNSGLEIEIKNQQFSGNNGDLVYYNITVNGKPIHEDGNDLFQYTQQSDGPDAIGTTNVILSISGEYGILEQYAGPLAGQQVTIQVQAMIGTEQWSRTQAFASQGYYFIGTVSDWSSPQTISVPANVPSTATSSLPSTSILAITNTISFIVIAVLLAVIIALLLLMRNRKTDRYVFR